MAPHSQLLVWHSQPFTPGLTGLLYLMSQSHTFPPIAPSLSSPSARPGMKDVCFVVLQPCVSLTICLGCRAWHLLTLSASARQGTDSERWTNSRSLTPSLPHSASYPSIQTLAHPALSTFLSSVTVGVDLICRLPTGSVSALAPGV